MKRCVFNTVTETLTGIFSDDDDQEEGHRNVNALHSNRDNFRIGEDYSLTISHLNMEQGAGKYFCRSTLDDGTINELHYLLTVLGE